jgi:hypothetical protein
MIGPTDLCHPSPAPHFKTFQVFLINCRYRTISNIIIYEITDQCQKVMAFYAPKRVISERVSREILNGFHRNSNTNIARDPNTGRPHNSRKTRIRHAVCIQKVKTGD